MSIEQKLNELKDLHAKGLISDSVYAERQGKVLDAAQTSNHKPIQAPSVNQGDFRDKLLNTPIFSSYGLPARTKIIIAAIILPLLFAFVYYIGAHVLDLQGPTKQSAAGLGDQSASSNEIQQAIALAEANKAASEAEIVRIKNQQEAEALRLQQQAAEAEIKQQQEALAQEQAQQRAQSIVEFVAPKIVESNWVGGTNIRAELYSSEYNSFNNTQIIKLGIAWLGAIDSSNQYWAQGIVNVQPDGSWSFSKTATSSNLQDVEGAMAVGKLGAQFSGFLN